MHGELECSLALGMSVNKGEVGMSSIGASKWILHQHVPNQTTTDNG